MTAMATTKAKATTTMADLELSVAIAMSIDDERYTEYLRGEGRRQLALAIARSLADRPDIIVDVH